MKFKRPFTSLQLRTKCYNISGISKENLYLDTKDHQGVKEPRFKCRYVVTMIGFILNFFLISYRLNLSVGIVAMVNNSASWNQTTSSSDSCPLSFENLTNETIYFEIEHSTEGEFNWSPEIQGYIHGGYSLSYMVIQLPAGNLMERYGCKWFVFWGTLIAAIATFLIPLASRINPYVIISMQILRGLGQGVYPSANSLLAANWFPQMERGLLFTFIQSGGALGGFLGSIICGLLCESTLLGGWPSSFYLFGIAGLILAVIVAQHLYESPSVHSSISDAELKYILSNQENVLTQRRPDTPWREIFSSVPVYSLAVALLGLNWGFSQFAIVNSTFLGTVLHYPIDKNGFLTSLPSLMMFLFSLVASWSSTSLTNRKYASIDQVRKYCSFTACLGYSLCMFGVYFSGCNRTWSSIFSVFSVAFIGVGFSGSIIAPADMSPTFAATVNSICLTFGCLSSLVLPLIVGYLTNEAQTLEQWNKVFFISIGVVMTSGIIFSAFGSAEVQPWNFVEGDKKEKEDKNILY